MPIPALIPLIGAGLGLAGTLIANRSARAEAERNRKFQERMSSTAHQREVMDLRAAGLNPILSAHGSGASSPSGSVAEVRNLGEGVERGIASALAVRQAKANIELTEAQAAAANAQGQLSNVQAGDILNTAKAGRMDLITAQRDVARMDLRQRESMLPLLLERARAETQSVKARTLLDKFAAEGYKNVAAFEKQMGAAAPWARFLFEVSRSISSGGRK